MPYPVAILKRLLISLPNHKLMYLRRILFKKSNFYLELSNKVFIFASVKTKKENANYIKYILVVAPVTTPTVVREQCSYVYM